MKRFVSVLLLLCLCAAPVLAEEPTGPAGLEETVWHLLDQPWTGEARCVAGYEDRGPYEEVLLGREHDDDRATVDPVARVLVDNATGRVVYYCRVDYEMPALPSADRQWEGDAVKRVNPAATAAGKAAMEAMAVLSSDDASAQFLCELDEKTDLYADCDYAGFIHSLLIVREAASEGASPVLQAYVDLDTNPAVGYDGYLTAEKAAEAGREALRAAFGDDVADHVRPDEPAFCLFDKVMMITVPEDLDEEGLWKMETEMNPIWVIRFLDPRGDIQSADHVPGYEKAYEYRLVLDAVTGEIIEMEGPWIFALG